MKTHLLAAFYLVVISIFFFSILGVLVGIFIVVTEPSLFAAIYLGVCAVVAAGYTIAMKLNSRFRKFVSDYFEWAVPPVS